MKNNIRKYFSYILLTFFTSQSSFACIDGACIHEDKAESKIVPVFVKDLQIDAADSKILDLLAHHESLKNSLYNKIQRCIISDASNPSVSEALGKGISYPNKVVASFTIVGEGGKNFNIPIATYNESNDSDPIVFASSTLSEDKIKKIPGITLGDAEHCIFPESEQAARNVVSLLGGSDQVFQKHLYDNTVEADNFIQFYQDKSDNINESINNLGRFIRNFFFSEEDSEVRNIETGYIETALSSLDLEKDFSLGKDFEKNIKSLRQSCEKALDSLGTVLGGDRADKLIADAVGNVVQAEEKLESHLKKHKNDSSIDEKIKSGLEKSKIDKEKFLQDLLDKKDTLQNSKNLKNFRDILLYINRLTEEIMGKPGSIKHTPSDYLTHNVVFYYHSEQALLNHLMHDLKSQAFHYRDRFQAEFEKQGIKKINSIILNVHTQRNMCKCCATTFSRLVDPKLEPDQPGLLNLLGTHVFSSFDGESALDYTDVKTMVVSTYTDSYDPSSGAKGKGIRNLMTFNKERIEDGMGDSGARTYETGALIQHKLSRPL